MKIYWVITKTQFKSRSKKNIHLNLSYVGKNLPKKCYYQECPPGS